MNRIDKYQKHLLRSVASNITSDTKQINLSGKDFHLVTIEGVNYLIDLTTLVYKNSTDGNIYIKFKYLDELQTSYDLQERLDSLHLSVLYGTSVSEEEVAEIYESILNDTISICSADDELRQFELSLFSSEVVSTDTICRVADSIKAKTRMIGITINSNAVPDIVKKHAIYEENLDGYIEYLAGSFRLSEGWKILINGEDKERHVDPRKWAYGNLAFAA